MFDVFDGNDNKNKLMVVGKIEGWSFLILLFVAMPLKYGFGIAVATQIVGMVHGRLFMWFLLTLYNFHTECKNGIKLTLVALIASLVPFGTFYLNKKLAILA